MPGTVQPNAYRKVSVTPLVGGRVTRVVVELGQTVARGALLAEVYSPEVAQARAAYLAAQADMEAGESRLRRTERLVTLGSASQQELDETRAEHVRHENRGREAAARLRLFGLDPARVGTPMPAGGDHRFVHPRHRAAVRRRDRPSGHARDDGRAVNAPGHARGPVAGVGDRRGVRTRSGASVTGAVATMTSEAYPDLQLHRPGDVSRAGRSSGHAHHAGAD